MDFTTFITCGPLTLEINYDYSPAEPDAFYLRNGDPGSPSAQSPLPKPPASPSSKSSNLSIPSTIFP